uniref:Uncharacterized protein n=1 Tax=Anas platyrhynchos platyrhynchos TaxID=8840 RepID=A0A493TC09_ANAPP
MQDWTLLKAYRVVIGLGSTAASCSQTENRVPKKQKLLQEESGIPEHPEHGIMDALVYVMNRNRINFM